jgi:hypothetical protein
MIWLWEEEEKDKFRKREQQVPKLRWLQAWLQWRTENRPDGQCVVKEEKDSSKSER